MRAIDKVHLGQGEEAKKLYEDRKALVKSTKLIHPKKNKGVLVSLKSLRVSAIETDSEGHMKYAYDDVHSPMMCVYIYCKLIKDYEHRGYIVDGKIDEEVAPPKKRGRPKKKVEEVQPEEVKIEEPKVKPVKVEVPKEKAKRKASKYEMYKALIAQQKEKEEQAIKEQVIDTWNNPQSGTNIIGDA